MRFPRGNGMGVTMDAEFKALEIGKGEILREGSDIGILALGSMVYPCLEAATRLEALGIHATVINARFMKPLDEELICCLAAEKQFLVTAEEGTEAGGFGSGRRQLCCTTGRFPPAFCASPFPTASFPTARRICCTPSTAWTSTEF
jgi:1-deoxy-D-xylulose-5-phosphate synthase